MKSSSFLLKYYNFLAFTRRKKHFTLYNTFLFPEAFYSWNYQNFPESISRIAFSFPSLEVIYKSVPPSLSLHRPFLSYFSVYLVANACDLKGFSDQKNGFILAYFKVVSGCVSFYVVAGKCILKSPFIQQFCRVRLRCFTIHFRFSFLPPPSFLLLFPSLSS